MLTKEEAVRQHRELWRWIAIETLRQRRVINKQKYFADKEYVTHCCYCCEYGIQLSTGKYCCDLCPIEWSSNVSETPCLDKGYDGDEESMYGLWSNTHTYKEAALLAYKISKLPEREFRFVIGKRTITETQLRDSYERLLALKETYNYNTWEDWIKHLLNEKLIKVK